MLVRLQTVSSWQFKMNHMIMNLPVLHQLKTSSKDGASLKPKMENIFVIMLACKK